MALPQVSKILDFVSARVKEHAAERERNFDRRLDHGAEVNELRYTRRSGDRDA
jgi:hypothetical protein